MLRVPVGGAEVAVELLRLLLFQQTLAVGRVRDDDAARSLKRKRAGVRDGERDQLLHAGAAGVLFRDLDGLGVDVRGIDVIVAGKLPRSRGGALGVPDRFRDHRPGFRGERAVDAGGAALGGERRLDGERTAAAERIAEFALAAAARDVHTGGGERLAQRRRQVRRAVAALVQPHAGRIEIQHRLVMHDRKLDLVLRALLRKPLHAVAALEPLDDGLLHDLLAVGDRVQHGFQAVTLYRKRTIHRYKILPRERLGALKQAVERVGAEAPQLDEHALAEAAAQIHPRDRGLVALKADAPVLGHDRLHVHAPELVSHKPLQPEQAGHAEIQFLHFVLLGVTRR